MFARSQWSWRCVTSRCFGDRGARQAHSQTHSQTRSQTHNQTHNQTHRFCIMFVYGGTGDFLPQKSQGEREGGPGRKSPTTRVSSKTEQSKTNGRATAEWKQLLSPSSERDRWPRTNETEHDQHGQRIERHRQTLPALYCSLF